MTNPAAQDGYVKGDQITVTASATNVGGLDYTSGSNLEIVYMDSITPIVVATKQLTNIQVQSSMSIQHLLTPLIFLQTLGPPHLKLSGLVDDELPQTIL